VFEARTSPLGISAVLNRYPQPSYDLTNFRGIAKKRVEVGFLDVSRV